MTKRSGHSILDQEIKLLINKKKKESESTNKVLFVITIVCILGFIFSAFVNNMVYYAIIYSFIIGLLLGNAISRNLFIDRISRAISKISTIKDKKSK